MVLRGTRAVWRREMRKWRRNRVQLVSSLLLPVVFLIVVGYAYSGTFHNITIAVINQDSAIPGQVYAQDLANSSSLSVVTNNISVSDAASMVNNGQIDGFIVIPVNFSEGFINPTIGGTKINVTVDNTNLMVSQALQAIAAQTLNETLYDPRVASWFQSVTGHPFQVRGSSINYINQYSSGYSFIDFLAQVS
jgi:ABC-type Na+ efflux pump permease subunit